MQANKTANIQVGVKFLVGLILIIGSVVAYKLFFSQTPNLGAQAQTPTQYDYQTTWKASELLTMKVMDTSKYAGKRILLGASGWEVEIKDPAGNLKYREIWSTPLQGMTYTATVSNSSKTIKNQLSADVDMSKWLFNMSGLADSNNYSYIEKVEFKSESKSGLSLGTLESYTDTSDDKIHEYGKLTNAGLSCIDGEHCLLPTGSYGWNRTTVDHTGDSMIGQSGVMIPLEWTVYGKQY